MSHDTLADPLSPFGNIWLHCLVPPSLDSVTFYLNGPLLTTVRGVFERSNQIVSKFQQREKIPEILVVLIDSTVDQSQGSFVMN